MALIIVDGYNVTRSDEATRKLSLAEQRDSLVARLRARGRDLLGPGRILVVFDGEGGVGAATGEDTPVEVVFSRGESADEVIVRRAASAGEKVVLISSDRGLRERVAAVVTSGRTDVRGCSSAWESRRPKRRGKGAFLAGSAGMPAGANKITEEMKRVWLDKEAE